MRDIRIAAVMVHSPAGQVRENMGRMETWIKRAKQENAGIICFPEMNVTGYSIKENIGLSARPVPGDIPDAVSQMADHFDMAVLFGMAIKDDQGRIYAAHLAAVPGKEVQVYRKLHLGPPEQGIYTAGDDIPVFEACGIRFGIQLCYDAHFPELSTHMTAKGAEVIFIPHASPRGTPEDKYNSWMRHLTARAYDNSVFIVACNQAGENGQGLTFPGISVVIGPSGEVMAKDLSGCEGMLCTDLKQADLDAVRNHRMRYFFPNRRPELY